ncbi:MAG: cysteine hydrolase family protein [Bacteroidota bacterium]|nr:cysteine hydrolase family protein [Bacteroidota bacterium]
MNNEKTIFWNVDTQVDFMEPDGKLYVPGAETIKPNLEKLTQFAKKHFIRVVNTADYHYINSAELSSAPNFIDSFPQHCMAGSPGSLFIPETNPNQPVIFKWDKEYTILKAYDDPIRDRNLVIFKDDFDVFKGNSNTQKILMNLLMPEAIYVYGVTTNVCVDKAVTGLVQRGYKVFVVEDAIKELPNLPLPFDNWDKMGVMRIKTQDVLNLNML